MIMTPLGRPVVPDVYIKRWMSSAAAVTRSALLGVGTKLIESCPTVRGGWRNARPDQRRLDTLVASLARSMRDSSQTSTRAPECSRMYRTSGAARRQLIGIAIAPR